MKNKEDNKNVSYVEIQTYIDGKLVNKEKKQLIKYEEEEDIYI